MDINTVNEEMSLAEALQLRADIKTRIAQLHSRLNDNAKVQEGETPAEDRSGLSSCSMPNAAHMRSLYAA